MAHDGVNGFYQGFFDFAIIASPLDADKLIIGGTSWWKSVDGAVSYTPLGGWYRALARRAPCEVAFLGELSAADIPRAYRTADVFVAPSTGQESFDATRRMASSV